MQPQFDFDAAGRAKREGMARGEAGAPAGWADAALEAVRTTAMEMPMFIVDEVWGRLPADTGLAPDLRAMGPVMRRAFAQGMVTPTETYRLSSRVSAHRNPRRVWRSMLC